MNGECIMTDIIYRAAIPEDLPQIAQLYDMKKNSRKYQQIKAWLTNQSETFHVAEINSEIIGGVAIRFPNPEEAWLSHKLIKPEIHNKGIGTSMALYEESIAKKNNAKQLRLATRVDNYPVHWMIGEKLRYYQVSRWIRIKRLKPSKNLLLPSSYYQFLNSPQIQTDIHLSSVQSFVENHVDYHLSYKLVPDIHDLTMYTKLDISRPDFQELYKAAILEENSQIKAVAIYTIKKGTNDFILLQLYSNRQDYSYVLLSQLLQFSSANGYFFSFLPFAPSYPIKTILKRWTIAPPSHYQPDWLILGKELF